MNDTLNDTGWTAMEVVEWADCTYRTLDYWVRLGLVDCAAPTPGSGHERRFTAQQAARAAILTRLRRAGLSLDTCRAILTDLDVDDMPWAGTLGPGLHLIIDGIIPPPTPPDVRYA